MRKITVPTKTERPTTPYPVPSPDAPRPRLGLRYGASVDARPRP